MFDCNSKHQRVKITSFSLPEIYPLFTYIVTHRNTIKVHYFMAIYEETVTNVKTTHSVVFCRNLGKLKIKSNMTTFLY